MTFEPTSVRPGHAHPLGASVVTDPVDGVSGVNFAVHSRHATAIEVQLSTLDPLGQPTGLAFPPRIALQPVGNGRWAAFVPGLQAGQRYVLHAHGPWAPENGQCFNADQPLIDPWACGLLGETEPLAYRGSTPPSTMYQDDPALTAIDPPPHCVVVDQALERAAGARITPRPHIATEYTVLCEAHVKALTRLHPDVPEALQGTYAGLACEPVLAHLKTLGITTLCLLPVHQRLSERHLQDKGLSNHWGYNPLQVFVPDPRLAACTGGQPPETAAQAAAVRDEFRQMVDALHRHGLEVVLDVVYNHTAEGDLNGPCLSWRGLDNATWYALTEQGQHHNFSGCGNSLNLGEPLVVQWVMDSLRWWVQAYGVDGFRFDLATSLGRQAEHNHLFSAHAPLFLAMAQDPVLAGVHLIAEPWDLGPHGYQLGQFGPRWQEWNDRFRDTSRAFWLGHSCTPGDMARALLGSSDRFHHSGRRPLDSINLVTAHDGFTLADLCAYNERHNLANGEHNRDGHAHNLSANGGVEGPTDNPAIQTQRQRWQRALLATLFVSQGTPQLLAGDELGHSQQGNNNAYCQDNPLTWLNWPSACTASSAADPAGLGSATPSSLLHCVQALASLRRAHPGLRRAAWYTGQSSGAPELARDCPIHLNLQPEPAQGPQTCPVDCPWATGCLGPDIVWQDLRGAPMTPARWNDPHERSLACVITVGETGALPTERLLLALHAGTTTQTLALPPGEWTLMLDTAANPWPTANDRPRAQGSLTLQPTTLVVLAQALLSPSAAAPVADPTPPSTSFHQH
jgi:glycogen operon protein